MVVNDLGILPTAMVSLESEWHDTMLKTRTNIYTYICVHEEADPDTIHMC